MAGPWPRRLPFPRGSHCLVQRKLPASAWVVHVHAGARVPPVCTRKQTRPLLHPEPLPGPAGKGDLGRLRCCASKGFWGLL